MKHTVPGRDESQEDAAVGDEVGADVRRDGGLLHRQVPQGLIHKLDT